MRKTRLAGAISASCLNAFGLLAISNTIRTNRVLRLIHRGVISIDMVVFIGKSLIARGGQNPVEAILMGKPVIIGPHMENFAALVRQLTKNRAVLCAGDGPELISHARSLLSDAALRERTSAAATK